MVGRRVAMNETSPLAGQVAFVTGASSGLGRATALALAGAGAGVALVARSVSDLAGVADEVHETVVSRSRSL
jgi:NAD(P)-dependent dehydrogenase (short-subunit alcohol dehydrogenase family)